MRFILILVCFTVAACRNSSNSAGVKLVGGKPDAKNHFPSVFIWTSEGHKLPESYCTAAKVAPRLLLTAAHCVLDQQRSEPSSEIGTWVRPAKMTAGHTLTYSFNRFLAEDDEFYETLVIKKIYVHPKVNHCLDDPDSHDPKCESRIPIVDIALIEVEPAGTYRHAEFAPLDFDWVGGNRPLFMMGYGSESETAENLPRLKFGYTKSNTNSQVIAALKGTEAETYGYPNLKLMFGVITDHSYGRGLNLGSGDSGGPVYDASSEYIIGVNSDGYCPLNHPDCQVTNNSIFARISDSNDADVGTWLESILTGR